MPTNIIFWTFVVSAIINCGYLLIIFGRILKVGTVQNQLNSSRRQPVSVIICAKNETQNLKRFLPSVLQQRYADVNGTPLFEVIVANDNSNDQTRQVLEELQLKYKNLVIVNIPENIENKFKGKKYPLSKALEIAKHELLVLTDADCKPTGEEWLAHMVQPLVLGKEIAVGYAGFFEYPNFLNKFIRWETMHTFLQYSTYLFMGVPYMAVGRNLACRKVTLQRVQETALWQSLPYGDDDMLVNLAGNKKNIALVSSMDAFVYSESKKSWGIYIRQKQRHLSTGKFYNPKAKVLLGVYALTHSVLWLSFLLLLATKFAWISLVLMLLRCIGYWSVWYTTCKKINEKQLFLYFPLFDFAWMIYNFVFSPYIFFKTRKNWT